MKPITSKAAARPVAVMVALQATNGDLVCTGVRQKSRWGALGAEVHFKRLDAIRAILAERFRRRTFWCLDLDQTMAATFARGQLPPGMRIAFTGSGVVAASIRDEGRAQSGKKRISRRFAGLEWHYRRPSWESLAKMAGKDPADYAWEPWPSCPPRLSEEKKAEAEGVLRKRLELLHETVETMCRFYVQNGGTPKLTAASTALDIWRRIYLPGHKLNYWLPPQRHKMDYMRPALFTGRDEMVASGTFEATAENPIQSIDVDSMYPAIATETVLPLVTDPWLRIRQGNDPFLGVALEDPDRHTLLEVTVNVPRMPLAPLPIRSETGKVIYPTGRLRGRWMGCELRYAMSLGVVIEEIHSGIVLSGGEKYLRDFCIDWWRHKSAAPEGSHQRENSKALLVAIVGKFAQRTGMSEAVSSDEIDPWRRQQKALRVVAARSGTHYPMPSLRPWPSKGSPRMWLCDHRTRDRTRLLEFMESAKAKTDEERAALEERRRSMAGRYPQHANIWWTAEINARARIELHRAALQCRGLLYMDTDGIKAESCAAMIGRTVAPSAPEGMGRWNLKHELVSLTVAAAKSYWGICVDGTPLHVLAGTPKELAAQVVGSGSASTVRRRGLVEAIRTGQEVAQAVRGRRRRPSVRQVGEEAPHVEYLADGLIGVA